MSSNTVAHARIIDVGGSERTSRRMFLGIASLLFAGSAALTIGWCESMSAMGGMAMPGGWTMSMAWMRMPGETWASAAASFLAMWMAMMVAMMLPSLLPTLWRYREALGGSGERSRDLLTTVVGAGYFAVWGVLGAVVFAFGDALATLEMQQPSVARAVPMAAGAVLMVAGALQFCRWKAHHLAYCLGEAGRDTKVAADAGTAWRDGLRLGMRCGADCGGWMAILLVLGVMDLRVMAVVTAAITAERLAPARKWMARVMGGVVVAAGLVMIARAYLRG